VRELRGHSHKTENVKDELATKMQDTVAGLIGRTTHGQLASLGLLDEFTTYCQTRLV
jgi:hypothetical protein